MGTHQHPTLPSPSPLFTHLHTSPNMPSTPSNDANGPQTHKRNISKANGKEMFVNTRTASTAATSN